MGHDPETEADQYGKDGRLVKYDLSIAKDYIGKKFHLDYSCDFRGRFNANQHLNYARQDYVRSMFRFANGARVSPPDMSWLEIHCANCEGSTDKETWNVRTDWVATHRDDIRRIAAKPMDTFDMWREADKPFAYVAACLELVDAWDKPKFETHLPIAFDGSCNGIQHLALLCRDELAGILKTTPEANIPCDWTFTARLQSGSFSSLGQIVTPWLAGGWTNWASPGKQGN
jgi:Autographiviridae RNA polymerase